MLSSCLARVASWSPVTGTPSAARRLGAADSKTRVQLVDAAERLLLDEGYAAVTSRNVAAKAGLKPQLIHYYFRTMDDLFIEVFRRNADASLARAERVFAEDPSLDAVFKLNADPRGAAFLIEFAALANHRKAIRAEIADYAVRNRAIQVKALRAAGLDAKTMPSVAVLLLTTGLGLILGVEESLGVDDGHEETIAFIEKTIGKLSPPKKSRA